MPRSPSQTPQNNNSPTVKEPQLPVDVFTRTSSIKGRKPPPPVPDRDGFVPAAPRAGSLKKGQHRVQSVYDNIASINTTEPPMGTSDQSNGGLRGQDSLKRNAGTVHRTPNFVTYIAVDSGSDEPSTTAETNMQQPYYPPPDYDDGSAGSENAPTMPSNYSRRTYGNWSQADGPGQRMERVGNLPESHMERRTTQSTRRAQPGDSTRRQLPNPPAMHQEARSSVRRL